MPENHLRKPGFTYSSCGPSTKNKARIQNLCKQKIQIIFTKMILIKFVLNMMWLMVKIKI